jgi:DNA repair exonuclease SbcCD ATPase subunit
MRIRSLEVEGFRGFGQRERIDLDADTLILVGVNGSGKTSLLDAIMWSLSGRLPRVEEPGGSVISEYAVSGEARVAVEVGLDSDRVMTVVRSLTREDDQTRLQIHVDGSALRGSEAQVELYRTLWPDALLAPDGELALLTALTRSVYLQQDLVREFVDADSDAERFEAVSELVGVGRVRELQVELDKARRAWSQVTNKLASEAELRAQRLRALDSQLERLTSAGYSESQLDDEWQAWWQRFASAYRDDVPALSAKTRSEAGSGLDDALKTLAAERRRDDRRIVEAEALLTDLIAEEQPGTKASPESLAAALDEVRAAAQSAQGALDSARALEAELREQAIRAEERSAQLAALAQLALQHLGDRCPVCTQHHDRQTTIAHLQGLIAASADGSLIDPSNLPDIDSLSAQVTQRQQRVRGLETWLQQLRAQEQAGQTAIAQRRVRLEALGIAGDSPDAETLRDFITRIHQRQQFAATLQDEGEALALALAAPAVRGRPAVQRRFPVGRVAVRRVGQGTLPIWRARPCGYAVGWARRDRRGWQVAGDPSRRLGSFRPRTLARAAKCAAKSSHETVQGRWKPQVCRASTHPNLR